MTDARPATRQSPTPLLTNTWRGRIGSGRRLLQRAGLAVGLTSCTVVALATIHGWIFDEPIDVAGPARSTVNRTALVGSYAQDCVTRWLTATTTDQQSLRDCFTLRDPIRLPTTPAVIVAAPAVAAVTLGRDTGTAQLWSVVVSVNERPYPTATAHTSFYRLPVIYSSYGVRAAALPARINGAGDGADITLGYPVTLPATSPAFAVMAGFLTSYLTPAGGLERYVTTDSHLSPAGDYRSATIVKLIASHNIPDTTPAEGTTVRVLATVAATTTQFAPRYEDYPATLAVTSGRWTVAGLDYTPTVADDAELTPILAPGPGR